MQRGCRGRRMQPRNIWKKDLEKEMWMAGFRYSWRKMKHKTELEKDTVKLIDI